MIPSDEFSNTEMCYTLLWAELVGSKSAKSITSCGSLVVSFSVGISLAGEC
jgi:hypothetical protein